MIDSTPGRLSELTDEELMRRVQADDTHAFDELYDRYHGRVFGSARRICETTERAEEAVQDAFLCLWTNRAGYDQTRGAVRGWIFTLTRNRSLDIYRANRLGDGLHASDAALAGIAAADSVEDAVVERGMADQLRASLGDLPLLQREVIVLAYFGGLTHVEIAGRLALPVGTVKGRMRLGLRKARTEIDRRYALDAGIREP